MRSGGLEPPRSTRNASSTGWCNRRSANCASNQRGRIRTFDPVLPKHVRYQTALHAGSAESLPVGIEPNISGLKDRDPDHWTTEALLTQHPRMESNHQRRG